MSVISKQGGKVVFGIGSYSSFTRKFSETDVRHFSEFLQDEDPPHFKLEKLKSMGFEKPFVYGAMLSSLFTKAYLSTFISPVYLSQSVNFSSPVYVDEEIEVKISIVSLEATKSGKWKCSLDSTIRKIEKNSISLTGSGLLLLKPETIEFIS
jgi:acyl dehydratase